MSDENSPKMTPEDGQSALMELLIGNLNASSGMTLDGAENILSGLEQIVAATGIEVPGFDAQNAAIRAGSSNARSHSANTDAALWVGDMARVDLLNSTPPQMDLAAMGLGFGSDADMDAYDDPDIADAPDFDFDMSNPTPGQQALLDEYGLSAEDFLAADAPDLYAEIAQGVPGAIAAFLATGADVNAPSGPSQHTPLLAALDAPGRSLETIAPLLDAGADLTAIHYQGDNALSWAMGYHHLETVTPDSEYALLTHLANQGVDPNHVTDGYWTVLHRAIVQGGAPQVAAILAAGGDLTTCMFDSFEPEKLANLTPLMLAAPKPDVFQLLLDHGADPQQPDAAGQLPRGFIAAEAIDARARAQADDPWTIAHAEALEASLAILNGL